MIAALRTAAFALSGLALLGQTPGQRAQIAFAPGGQFSLDLEAGDYDLVPGPGDGIVVTWITDGSGQPKVQLEGAGSQARLRVAHTPHQNFHVRVEVPARCDLRVRLTAGDLKVGPIEGNKDLFTRAGDLRVSVPRPEAYGPVRASVWAGDIHAQAFGGEKGGLFRSFEWQGKGAYTLRIATWAGDITLAP
ncbi:MAG TPA: hypothetical protein VF804_08315 [Holophagaceae bacterium]